MANPENFVGANGIFRSEALPSIPHTQGTSGKPKYRPAHELTDGRLERCGRALTQNLRDDLESCNEVV